MANENNTDSAVRIFTDSEVDQWQRMRFTEAHGPMLAYLVQTGAIELNRVYKDREELDEDDFDSEEEYEAALEEQEEEREGEEELYGYPAAQCTMYTPDFDLDPQMAIEAGFVVYEVDHDPHCIVPFDMVIGVDGGGYSFRDQHWRPLREAVNAAFEAMLERDYSRAAATLGKEAS